MALGFADIVATATATQGLRKSYKAAFWLEVALAAVALVLLVGFVKLDKAKSQLTADEKEELQMQGQGAEVQTDSRG